MSTHDTQITSCLYCIDGYTPADPAIDLRESEPYAAMQEHDPDLAATFLDVALLDDGPLGPGYQLCTQCAEPCPACDGLAVFPINIQCLHCLQELCEEQNLIACICYGCSGVAALLGAADN